MSSVPLAMGNGTAKAMIKASAKKRTLTARDFDFQYQEKPLKLVKREYDSDEESEDLTTRVKLVDRHRHSVKQVLA